MKISVLGAGAWGTALAVHLARAGHTVQLWARRPELAAVLATARVNSEYLPGIPLPDSLLPTADLAATTDNDVLLVVVPSHGFREVLRSYLACHPTGRTLTLVSGTKGIETETLERMSGVTAEEAAKVGVANHFAVLSGPSFAQELGEGRPTAAVIAAADEAVARDLCQVFSNASFRLYSSMDVVGVELGGTAKNVIAVAAGVVSGLELGYNTQAVLITRGLHEITRLGVALGGSTRTFSGLSGLGDLVLTCTGRLSRNRRVGIELAKGRKLAEILADNPFVAEGVKNSVAVSRLAASHAVEMPITQQVVEVLYEGKSPKAALLELMTRDLKSEPDL